MIRFKKETEKYSKMGKASVASREKTRLERSNDRADSLPDTRKEIIVRDYDSGECVETVYTLKKARRIDMFRVFKNGERWKICGLSRVLESIRKDNPRVLSEINF